MYLPADASRRYLCDDIYDVTKGMVCPAAHLVLVIVPPHFVQESWNTVDVGGEV